MKSIVKYNVCLSILIFSLLGCSSNSEGTDDMEMQNDEPVQFDLSVLANPTEGGTVSPSNGTYDEGTSVNIQATPSEGYTFQEWTGNAQSDINPLTIVMDANKTINAVFQESIETCDLGTFDGDVNLETQEEINEFGNLCYTGISGNLSISGLNSSSITDLSALSNLKEVGGEIAIVFHSNLNNFSGLENVDSASGLRISNVSNIENLDVFNNLIQGVIDSNKVDFSIAIGACPELTSVTVFSGITQLKNLRLGSLNKLETLDGFQFLEHVSDTMILGNFPLMSEYNNLENLRTVGIQLTLSFTTSFLSLEGLGNLESVGESFFIQENTGLESLQGLNSNLTVERLWIEKNPALNSLAGLNINGSVNLRLDDNDALINLNGANFSNSNNMIFVLQFCDGIVDLSGMESISSMETVFIRDNTSLVSLSGLENLNELTTLVNIIQNESLQSFCALDDLINNGNLMGNWDVFDNLFNPTLQDMESGNCEL
ncbi:InlB B-repeat-containing protein [Croceitalea vernalis]|uniref:Bacterial repeat domain-containing protein n=1 Tax=Croceitalea vernalis TaxID=3075599 RepID=A0ABU3BDG1_9FLAO|nr:hypothetical protein [Croceitalea sp. P007]MDT0620384.1 hypothetical protein [Croceitalea sp. P007]